MIQARPRKYKHNNQDGYKPTQAEIRIVCGQIQSGWTPEEEAFRRTGLSLLDQLANPIPHIRNAHHRKSSNVDTVI